MKSIKKTFFCFFLASIFFLNFLHSNTDVNVSDRNIHWVSNNNGEQYAGLHILAEFWGVKPETFENLNTDDLLRQAANKAGAAALEIISHKFDSPNKDLPPGLTSAVILEESHITIHTWLEEDGYVAVDAFTCGPKCKPEKAVEYLKEILKPTKVEIQEIKRGYKPSKFKAEKKQITFKANAKTETVDITQDLIAFLNQKKIEIPKPFTIAPETTQNKIDEWFSTIENYKKESYKRNDKVFGEELTLDLYDCDNKLITSKEKIAQYAIELCELIDMKRFGEPFLEYFAEHSELVAGYSLSQMIETSLISGHFSDFLNRAYINIFSCKTYDPKKALEFTKKYFGAKSVRITFNIR